MERKNGLQSTAVEYIPSPQIWGGF